MLISRESIEALELTSLLRLIAEDTATDVGRQRVLELRPSSSHETLSAAVNRGLEAQRLLADGVLVPSQEEALIPVFERLDGGSIEIAGSDLVRVRQLLEITLAAARRIETAEPACPSLTAMTAKLPDLGELASRLARMLDSRGGVRDDATPLLSSLRRRGQKVRQATFKTLESYARAHAEELAEDTVPFHQERFVVLLRAGAKGRLKGLVHDRSGSGQSFYFEPLEVVEANNELRSVSAEEDAERRRILLELVEATLVEREALAAHLELLAELDVQQAAARWAARIGARWFVPAPADSYRLVEARHPLLDPSLAALRARALGLAGHSGEVVPLSIDLCEERRLLVVTGPNAGGKTVALKTLGLLAVAAHCGLPVPARPESQIPLLDRVVASVGDEQDLLADRSTFSGRLLRLKEAWEWAGPTTLILLDELGSGTDPEEGAALGIGLIEELVARRSLAVVSSHLTRLAAAALELEGAACAAMAFDAASGRPTFRLVPGTPGGSEALALARRLDLAPSWVARAEELLGPDHGRLQQVLAEVEEVRADLARERDGVVAERKRLSREREASEAARQDLEAARNRAGKDARLAVGDFRRQVRKRLGKEVERLRAELESGRKRGLEAAAIEQIFRDAPVPEREPTDTPVEIGGRVRHRDLGWIGTVQKLERGKAEVAVEGKRVICRASELDGLQGEVSQRRPSKVSTPMVEEAPARELDLRGQRVEAGLDALDSYLDRALLASMVDVRVVHGHGSGQLKQAVREALGNHPAVAKWRPGGRGEGGDGATVIVLAS
ncbi:MAG: Smr/MutS family protein [Acidobacteriota bacterium]|nr:Smr/MutS family protein [Acidobacteriota bacterium]